ncbi:hypothetical protein [Panacagrimonas sp.]|uniref:hypothetical protein n=1 Tax=Panacagrimonas sp. TaxID=2480088 RepID=UPI003B51D78B
MYATRVAAAVDPSLSRKDPAGCGNSHDQKDAEGFIRLNDLRLRTGAIRDQR